MKKLFVLFLLMGWGICWGQNLVPNGSFEDTVACPTGQSQLNKAVGWSSYSITPECFNSCNSFVVGIPLNSFGFQDALSGNGYAGFANYLGGHNIREYIGTQLAQPLNPGVKYFVSFYVSRGKIMYANTAMNKIGAKFSTVAYSQANPEPIDNSAQIFTDSVIDDTLNWTKVSGSFIADSAYQYLSIGNHFNDSMTTYIYVDSTGGTAYYYLDDVCVSTDSLTCNPSIKEGISDLKSEEEFILFPNPFQDKINITTKRNEEAEVILYDVTTRKLLQQKFTTSTTLSTAHLAKGIYFFEVRNKNGVVEKGKVVKE